MTTALSLPQTLKKKERLCSQKAIEALFGSGSRSLSAYPLRAVYRKVERGQTPAVVLISVSKRRLHHAVDRNRVKRQLREAYRRNKHLLWQSIAPEVTLHIAFIWLSSEHFPSDVVEARMVNLLQRISEKQ